MLDKHSPIGIIDSGIGGYSVARRLQNHLPHEDLDRKSTRLNSSH